MGALLSLPAQACNSCGQAFSFTPKLLLISSGFFLLPVTIVALIVWRVWKDEKSAQKASVEGTSVNSSSLDAPSEKR